MIYLIIIAICFGIFAWLEYKRTKSKRTRHVLSILAFENTARNYLKRIPSLPDTRAKVQTYEKAGEALRRAGRYPECREIIQNYDSLLRRIKRISMVLPVYDLVEKSHEFHSNDDTSSEKQILLAALRHIKTYQISNQDFMIADIKQNGTDNVIQIEDILYRLKDLERDSP